MAIKTPDLLPGEEGYVSKKEKTIMRVSIEKKGRIKKRKQEQIIGKIKLILIYYPTCSIFLIIS